MVEIPGRATISKRSVTIVELPQQTYVAKLTLESRTANMSSGLVSAGVLSSEQNDVFMKYDVLLTSLVSG